MNCGQINAPEKIETAGAPVPENDIKTNGYFYNFNGKYEGHVTGQNKGRENDVYACDGQSKEKDIFVNMKKLTSDYQKFIRDASTTYGESSAVFNILDKNEFFAIASVHKRNKVAFGVNSNVIFPKNRNEYKYSFKFGKDETKQIYRSSDRENFI